MSFEASLRDVPRHFAADGDLVLSHVAASLSAVFPDGEDFFVRSWRQLRAYNRHGFHPDDRETGELVERWRTELFGSNGTLNDKLAGSAA